MVELMEGGARKEMMEEGARYRPKAQPEQDPQWNLWREEPRWSQESWRPGVEPKKQRDRVTLKDLTEVRSPWCRQSDDRPRRSWRSEGAQWIREDDGPRWSRVGEKPSRSWRPEGPRWSGASKKGAKGLKGASEGGTEELDGLGRRGGRGRLGETISDKEDLELDATIGNRRFWRHK